MPFPSEMRGFHPVIFQKNPSKNTWISKIDEMETLPEKNPHCIIQKIHESNGNVSNA